MNANELADALEDAIEDPWNAEEWVRVKVKEAATMLRQQQEKINKYELRHEEQRNRITHLEADLKYFTDPCNPLCKPSTCDCYQARFAIRNRKAQEK